MLYKFIGADDPALLSQIFDSIVVDGRVRFTPAARFNDPQEFKHRSAYPEDYGTFDRWHDTFDVDRSREDRREAWRNLTGGGRDFIVDYEQRLANLSRLAVTCFAQSADNFLMWSHYSRAHTGFAVMFNDGVLEPFRHHAGWLCDGPVDYLSEPPVVEWFKEPPQSVTQKIIFSKSNQWAYEREFRVVMDQLALEAGGLVRIPVSSIAGVVLGARIAPSLRTKALSLKAARPDFRVTEVSPRRGAYGIDIIDIDANSTRLFREIL
ncbi:MAG: DUF2971 domain-containing protein [Caulobacterales bacterium]|nr:DUF2971 domain-containing protein [Caulobacterales bacterium]